MDASLVWIALLRAVNVGGTGKLAMTDFAACCRSAGFNEVKTFIQSGNAVFRSAQSEDAIRSALARELERLTGRPFGVFIRSGAELARLVAQNPFPGEDPAKIAVAFLPGPPESSAFNAPGGEQIRPGERALYVYYPDGMGRSKLKLPTLCTVRNMNTIAKLAAMAAG